jgi:hypothetical protein
MRWVGYVACMGDEKFLQNFGHILKGRDHSKDLHADGRIILQWILGKEGWKVWIGFIWLRIGTGGGDAC